VVDSLKALDPEWPIREADINRALPYPAHAEAFVYPGLFAKPAACVSYRVGDGHAVERAQHRSL